jgi:hypothetical protein
MKLDLSGTELAQPITDELIIKSVESLGASDDSFLILSKGEMHYIQTAHNGNGGYVLEYRDGSDEAHYECVDSMLTSQKISAAFLSYFHETDDWKTSLHWEPLGSSQENGGGGSPKLLMIFLVVLALVASIFLMLSV